MQNIIIVVVAAIIGVIYLLQFRKMDFYEKEPISKLLLVAIIGGVISVITSLMIYEYVETEHTFWDAIFKVGLFEELSKLIALMVIYRIIEKDFNEIVDGLVYITAVALGFSIIENVFYSMSSDAPFVLLAQRSFFAVLGHVSFSGYMGIAYYIHKRVRTNHVGIAISVAVAALAHGLYDGFLFEAELNSLFNFVFIGIVVAQYWMLKTALGFSEFRKELAEDIFIPTHQDIQLECANCKANANSKVLRFESIEAAKCQVCGNLVFDTTNMARLFKYYRPAKNYKRYAKKLPKLEGVVKIDEDGHVFYDTQRKTLSANVVSLGGWFNTENQKDRSRILQIPVIGQIFRMIGLRYLCNVVQ